MRSRPLMLQSCKSGTWSSCLSLWLQSLAGFSYSNHAAMSSPLGLWQPFLVRQSWRGDAGLNAVTQHSASTLPAGDSSFRLPTKPVCLAELNICVLLTTAPGQPVCPALGSAAKTDRRHLRLNPWMQKVGTCLNPCQGTTRAQMILILPNTSLSCYQTCKKKKLKNSTPRVQARRCQDGRRQPGPEWPKSSKQLLSKCSSSTESSFCPQAGCSEVNVDFLPLLRHLKNTPPLTQ